MASDKTTADLEQDLAARTLNDMRMKAVFEAQAGHYYECENAYCPECADFEIGAAHYKTCAILNCRKCAEFVCPSKNPSHYNIHDGCPSCNPKPAKAEPVSSGETFATYYQNRLGGGNVQSAGETFADAEEGSDSTFVHQSFIGTSR